MEGASSSFFDGGSAGKLGTGGYVCFDAVGEWHMGAALWYGKDRATNNEAEAGALRDLLSALMRRGVPAGVATVVIFGDSRLVIDFANRAAKPGKASLFLLMREVATLKRQLGVKVLFRHVLREQNALADWLTNVARTLGRTVEPLTLDLQLGDSPPWPPQEAPQRLGVPPQPMAPGVGAVKGQGKERSCTVCSRYVGPSARNRSTRGMKCWG